ncbi:MAG: hypothetical protein EB060_04185 [Proteobacteria bacterium]|nr:hypothetical protein [Pseudomonadota bacterium]
MFNRLDKVFSSDSGLLLLLMILAILNYGWIFSPILAQVWNLLFYGSSLLVIVMALTIKIYRNWKR